MYRPSSSLATSNTFLDVESTIRGFTQDYCTAFNTGNYDQVAALFTTNGLCMAPHKESAQGPRAIEHLLRQLSDAGHRDLRFETQRVDHSGDLAVESGRYTLAVQLENGASIAERGKFLHAWRRLGAWLLMADSWSSDLPAVR